MTTILKSLVLILVLMNVVGCCDRRCGVYKQSIKEIPQPDIELRLEKIKKERGGK